MINLEIFENSSGGSEGTLFEILNRCTTSFGKRLFKRYYFYINITYNIIDSTLKQMGLPSSPKYR